MKFEDFGVFHRHLDTVVVFTPKNYHLFKIDKARIEQCYAAHSVQQY